MHLLLNQCLNLIIKYLFQVGQTHGDSTTTFEADDISFTDDQRHFVDLDFRSERSPIFFNATIISKVQKLLYFSFLLA
jgi:hypothetical protein